MNEAAPNNSQYLDATPKELQKECGDITIKQVKGSDGKEIWEIQVDYNVEYDTEAVEKIMKIAPKGSMLVKVKYEVDYPFPNNPIVNDHIHRHWNDYPPVQRGLPFYFAGKQIY